MNVARKPSCPHCGEQMEEYQIPLPLPDVAEELEWESDFLWVCINDECPLFVNGWKNMAEKYGQLGSFRYMIRPDSGEAGVIPAFQSDTVELMVEERRKTRSLTGRKNSPAGK